MTSIVNCAVVGPFMSSEVHQALGLFSVQSAHDWQPVLCKAFILPTATSLQQWENEPKYYTTGYKYSANCFKIFTLVRGECGGGEGISVRHWDDGKLPPRWRVLTSAAEEPLLTHYIVDMEWFALWLGVTTRRRQCSIIYTLCRNCLNLLGY